LRRLHIRKALQTVLLNDITIIRIARTVAGSGGHAPIIGALGADLNLSELDQFLRKGQIKALVRWNLPLHLYLEYIKTYSSPSYLGKRALLFLMKQPQLALTLSYS